MENFGSFDLPISIIESIKNMGFKKPTQIQSETIPIAIAGKDILGSAQTGTGKTAAYSIPLITHLINNPKNYALVVTPTRELAIQALDTIKQIIGKNSDIKTSLIIGGEPMNKQLNQLKNNPRIIVGTPGRINDHLTRKTLKLSRTSFVVFDETDRMLDLGFSVQLQAIEKYLPKERQTLMFSATMPPSIVKLANGYLTDPLRITVGSTVSPVHTVKQEIIKTSESEKYNILIKQLEESEGAHIVFVKTKSGADKLAGKLNKSGHSSNSLHGDLRQRTREKIVKDFRNYKQRILVATDIAARGIDIPHLECVINYDLPQCPEDYIHRVGRTGRAGAKGLAISLVTSQESKKWQAICKLIDPKEISHSKEKSENQAQNKNDKELRKNKKDFSNRNEDKNKKSFSNRNENKDKKSFSNRNESKPENSYKKTNKPKNSGIKFAHKTSRKKFTSN